MDRRANDPHHWDNSDEL